MLMLDLARIGLYTFLGWLAWMGEIRWWVPVGLFMWDSSFPQLFWLPWRKRKPEPPTPIAGEDHVSDREFQKWLDHKMAEQPPKELPLQ